MSDASIDNPVRESVREKYAAPPRRRNRPLELLGWFSLAAALLGLVAVLVTVTSAGTPLTVAIWSSLIIPFLSVGAFALIAFLSVQALLAGGVARERRAPVAESTASTPID